MEKINISNVAVIGAGTMGQGIAQWFCQQGLVVQLVDAKIEFAQNGKNNIETHTSQWGYHKHYFQMG